MDRILPKIDIKVLLNASRVEALNITKQSQTPLYPIICIGGDPATVNYAQCRLAYYGHVYRASKLEPGALLKVPHIKILNFELWDPKNGFVYYSDANFKLQIRRILVDKNNINGNANEFISHNTIACMGHTMARIVSTTEWLYERFKPGTETASTDPEARLAEVVTEVQCGFIKNHELDVTVMGYMMPGMVLANDLNRGLHGRSCVQKQRKYGLKNDGSLPYEGRKSSVVDIGDTLFELNDLDKLMSAFMDEVKVALRKQGKTVKVNDFYDAMLLALNRAIEVENDYERQGGAASRLDQELSNEELAVVKLTLATLPKRIKQQKTARKKAPPTKLSDMPDFPSDDDESDDFGAPITPKERSKRKKTPPNTKKKPVARKRIVLSAEKSDSLKKIEFPSYSDDDDEKKKKKKQEETLPVHRNKKRSERPESSPKRGDSSQKGNKKKKRKLGENKSVTISLLDDDDDNNNNNTKEEIPVKKRSIKENIYSKYSPLEFK